MLKADLHVHTRYSIDCYMSLSTLITTCEKKDITCIAVTDHGTTKGARELSKSAPFKVVIGEEILTPHGEIMGLFLQYDIQDKITVEEAIKQIRQQGGLICIPHPFDKFRPSAFRDGRMLEYAADQSDIIEVFNSRSLFPGTEGKARDLAKRHGKLMSAGTDAHSSLEIGYTYVEMDDFNTTEEFLLSLSHGTICGKKTSPFLHILSTTARLAKNNTKV